MGNEGKQRRRRLQSTPLIPPDGMSPGVYWAEQQRGFGPSNLQVLLQELEELRDPRYGATQIAIELLDEGERTPWDGAGDMQEFRRDPWGAVVWIGRPDDAQEIIVRLLHDQIIGSVLCRGATIKIHRRGETDADAHLAELEQIRERIVLDPFETSLPITTQAIRQATRLAYPRGSSAPPVRDWPPDDDWNIRDAEYAYLGGTYQIKGMHARLLKLFIQANGAVSEETLRREIWPNSEPEGSTILSTLSHLRLQLRSNLGLPKGFDPLPNQDHGERHRCWKLDREGIRRLLSRI